MNCLQGANSEESRDKRFKYCKDNKAVKFEMPEKGSFLEVSQWTKPIQGAVHHVCRLRSISQVNR